MHGPLLFVYASASQASHERLSTTTRPARKRTQPTMASDQGKENIADGLFAGASFAAPAPSPKKPPKPAKKTRSKSIGPGGLGALEEPVLKESSGNRRKVRISAK